jgi:hypothetical protein
VIRSALIAIVAFGAGILCASCTSRPRADHSAGAGNRMGPATRPWIREDIPPQRFMLRIVTADGETVGSLPFGEFLRDGRITCIDSLSGDERTLPLNFPLNIVTSSGDAELRRHEK